MIFIQKFRGLYIIIILYSYSSCPVCLYTGHSIWQAQHRKIFTATGYGNAHADWRVCLMTLCCQLQDLMPCVIDWDYSELPPYLIPHAWSDQLAGGEQVYRNKEWGKNQTIYLESCSAVRSIQYFHLLRMRCVRSTLHATCACMYKAVCLLFQFNVPLNI